VIVVLSQRCAIQLSYGIGLSFLLSFYLITHGNYLVDPVNITNCLQEIVDLSPRGIGNKFVLERSLHSRTVKFSRFALKPEPFSLGRSRTWFISCVQNSHSN
jgi:S-adenosylmethionine synthetase